MYSGNSEVYFLGIPPSYLSQSLILETFSAQLGLPLFLLLIIFSCSSFSVHGGYSHWYPLTRCTRSCGQGKKLFVRYCNNPPPALGGRSCRRLGPRYEYQSCNTQKCPGRLLTKESNELKDRKNMKMVEYHSSHLGLCSFQWFILPGENYCQADRDIDSDSAKNIVELVQFVTISLCLKFSKGRILAWF